MAVTCLIIAGCGSKSTEAAPGTKAFESVAAESSTDTDASTSSGGTWNCDQYAAGGVDYMSQSAAYLFIGEHPMCTAKDKVQQFCNSIRTRECAGYLVERTVGEGIDWDFNGNQTYKFFCKSATNYDDRRNLKLKGPAAR